MLPSGCIIEDAQALLIRHLVIAYVQVTWIENGRVQVEDVDTAIISLELTKVLLC